MATRITDPPAQHWVLTCAPLIAIVFVVVTHFLFLDRFLACPKAGPKCINFDTGPMLQAAKKAFTSDTSVYVGGVLWTLASGLRLLVSLSVLIAAAFVIREGIGKHAKGRRGALTLALITAWAAAISLLASSGAIDRDMPGFRLMSGTIGRTLPDIVKYNVLFDALGLTVGVVLAVAACAAIRRDAAQDTEESLSRRMWLLRRVLYAGAAALVVSVAWLSVTLNWAGSFLPGADTPAGKEVSTLIAGIVNSLGISYTLLLAALYLPAALVLRGRTHALAVARQQPPDKRDEWLKARGLALSYAEYLPRLVAVLAPLLVGPVADLVKNVLNVGGGK